MSERKLQAIKYNPRRTSEEVRQDTQDYIDIKEKGSIPGRPEVTPHHIRGLRDYEDAFDHLTPENQDLIQKELEPYGLSLGDGKANLQGAEGRFSRSNPGRTATMGKGGLHQKLHEEQRIASQKLGLDKSRRTFTGVAGTPWSKMSQKDIMAFIRANAVSDEMTVNRTIGQFYGLPSLPPIEKIKNQVQQQIFGNRLTSSKPSSRPTTTPSNTHINKTRAAVMMGNRLMGAGTLGTETHPLGGSVIDTDPLFGQGLPIRIP